MTQSRIYTSQSLVVSQKVELEKAASHHLLRVLRMRKGQSIVLFNGDGRELIGSIISTDEGKVVVDLLQEQLPEVESPIHIHLAQGVSRGERMDFVMQKAVELGVSEITPIITERCNVKLDAKRWQKKCQHWLGVIISACEQSGRCCIPKLHEPIKYHEFLQNEHSALKLICDPHDADGLKIKRDHISSCCLLIGPEGGFTELEVSSAHSNGFDSIKLGPRILRTETAAMVALAVVQSQIGDLI